jgi:wyosine [tRNA(Phe)-imidazoG37] synthetase (radical SAM superfamily)
LNTLRKQRINAEIDILKKNMETQNAEQKVETLKEIMRLTVELSGIQRAQAKRKEV